MADGAKAFPEVLQALESTGLLLLTDRLLPSVTSMVAGEPVRGSWWSHPRSHQIYAVATRLEDDPDVTTAKLVSGKVTFVHRRLWPSLLAVVRSGEPWQREGLSAEARSLLASVETRGQIRLDSWLQEDVDASTSKRAAGELEKRLLVHVDEVHTESGAHSKALESWGQWARRTRVDGQLEAVAGRQNLEQALAAMEDGSAGSGRLPWQ